MVLRPRLAIVAAAALLLAGCGGNDGAQRKAFVTFLQTRILDKPGLHMPQLTDEERTSFGPYADQYTIITNFNKTMDESVSPKLTEAMSAGSISSLEDLVNRRSQLQAAKATIDQMNGVLGSDLANADAAHAKLDQPADVKPVFDKAYDRLVTQPASAFRDVVPIVDKVLGQSVELGDYIAGHQASVRVSGSMIDTRDPAVRAAITEKVQALQASQEAVQAAQTKMQALVHGDGT